MVDARHQVVFLVVVFWTKRQNQIMVMVTVLLDMVDLRRCVGIAVFFAGDAPLFHSRFCAAVGSLTP